MPRHVVVEGEGEWEFPDDATDGEIAVAINSEKGLGPAGKPEFAGRPKGYQPTTSAPLSDAVLHPFQVARTAIAPAETPWFATSPVAPPAGPPSPVGSERPSGVPPPAGGAALRPGSLVPEVMQPQNPLLSPPPPQAPGMAAGIAGDALGQAATLAGVQQRVGQIPLVRLGMGQPTIPARQAINEPGLDDAAAMMPAAAGGPVAGQAGAFAARTGANLVEGASGPEGLAALAAAAASPIAAAGVGAFFTLKMVSDLLTKTGPKAVEDVMAGDKESALRESGPAAAANLLGLAGGALGTKAAYGKAGGPPIADIPGKFRALHDERAARAESRPLVDELLQTEAARLAAQPKAAAPTPPTQTSPVPPEAPAPSPGGAARPAEPPARPVAPPETPAPPAPPVEPQAAPAVATEAAGKPVQTVTLEPPAKPPAEPPSTPTIDAVLEGKNLTPLERVLASEGGKTTYPIEAVNRFGKPITVTGPPEDHGEDGIRVPIRLPNGAVGTMPVANLSVPVAAPAPAQHTTEAPASARAVPPADDRRWDEGIAAHVDNLLEKKRNGTATRAELEDLVEILGERADTATRESRTHYSGIPNKRAWDEDVAAGKHSQFIATDIKGFKWFNDTLGQTAGDAAITQAAQTIHATVRRWGGSAYAIGGDEFAIGLPASVDRKAVEREVTSDLGNGVLEVTGQDGKTYRFKGIPIKILGGNDAGVIDRLKTKGRATPEPWRALEDGGAESEGAVPDATAEPAGVGSGDQSGRDDAGGVAREPVVAPGGAAGEPTGGALPGGAAEEPVVEPKRFGADLKKSDPSAYQAFHRIKIPRGMPAPPVVAHGEPIVVPSASNPTAKVRPVRAWVAMNPDSDQKSIGYRRTGGWEIAPGLVITEGTQNAGSEYVNITHAPSGLSVYHGKLGAALRLARALALMGIDWTKSPEALRAVPEGGKPEDSDFYRAGKVIHDFKGSKDEEAGNRATKKMTARLPAIYDENAIALPPEPEKKGKKKATTPAESEAPQVSDKGEVRPYRRPDGSVGYKAVPIVGEAPSPLTAKVLKIRDEIIAKAAPWNTFDKTIYRDKRGVPQSWATARDLAEYIEARLGLKIHKDYSANDLYDAIELAVNKLAAQDRRFKGNRENLRELIQNLPTKTVRDLDTDRYQQFSTPADYSAVVAKLAGIGPDDVVLEPTVGLGSLAAAAVGRGARVIGNELEPGRADLVKAAGLGIDRVYTENAEFINAALAKHLKGEDTPTVVLMNPPFSAAVGTDTKAILTGGRHIAAAFRTLRPGGRLVAIVGAGMSPDAPKYRPAFDEMKNLGGVLMANLDMSDARAIYAKYGTTFPTRVLIWDKRSDVGGRAHEFKLKNLKQLEDFAPRIAERAKIEKEAPGEGARPGEQRAGEPRGEGETLPGGDAESGLPVRGPADEVGADAGGGAAAPDSGRAGDRGLAPRDAGERGAESGVEVAPRPGRAAPEPRHGSAPAPDAGGSRGEPSGSDVRPAVAGDGEPRPDTRKLTLEEPAAPGEAKELTESVYESYEPKIRIRGAQPHPAKLVESAAMSAVAYPPVKYVPEMPEGVVENGGISDAQLEAVVLAGASHDRILPSGERRGFLVGDGTGVGKARIIGGIIADNVQRGRRRAIWVTETWRLVKDIKAEAEAVGLDPAKIIPLNKIKLGTKIPDADGIVVVTYDTLKPKKKAGAAEDVKTPSRVNQLLDWLGEGFEGVIAYDESHNMANAIAIKNAAGQGRGRGTKQPSAKALAGLDLARAVPKARVVYASATAASEVSNLAYADRLGLWGEETAFPKKENFIADVSSGGIAAMELVAQGMKAMGVYCARTLSFDGVEVERLQHNLTDDQRSVWGELAGAWRLVFQKIDEALGITAKDHAGNVSGSAKAAARSAFWGANQRFWNQVLTSMQMPSVLRHVEGQLAAGHAAVVQLTNTLEAQLTRSLGALSEEDDLDSLDMTPREQLLGYVERSFPVYQMTEQTDEDGNTRMVIAKDSSGDPIENPEAVALREELLTKLGSIRVPDGPLEQLINHFGTDVVAEVTGRQKRAVRRPDGKVVVEKRGGGANEAEVSSFMQDRKKILVFSEAGGTGASYHASRRVKNQRRRYHYLVQPGWRADKAIQGLGRTHRANQASAPVDVLVSTEVPGHKRFVSTIARRLAQAGALTKGQRSAAGQGMFTEADNLESPMAREAMADFIKDLAQKDIDGLSLAEFERNTGLALTDPQTGSLRADLPPITQILNRLLSMPLEEQTLIFDAFLARLQNRIQVGRQNGTLELGVEDIHADEVQEVRRAVVFTDPRSGAKTQYVELVAKDKRAPVPFPGKKGIERYLRNRTSGRIHALSESRTTTTDKDGTVRVRLQATTPWGHVWEDVDDFYEWANRIDEKRFEEVSLDAAKALWEEQTAQVPKFRETPLHLITGALLPIWNRLGSGTPRVRRVKVTGGERLLGRLIDSSSLDAVLTNLGVGQSEREILAPEIIEKVLHGKWTAKLANGWRLKRSLVTGTERIEVDPGRDSLYPHHKTLTEMGLSIERHQYAVRYFFPADEALPGVLERFLRTYPAVVLSPPAGKAGLADRVASKGPGRNRNAGEFARAKRELEGRQRPERAPRPPLPERPERGEFRAFLDEFRGDIQKALSPQTVSPAATVAGDSMRENAARSDYRLMRANALLGRARAELDRLKERDVIGFLDAIEKGERQSTPALQDAADLVREILDEARDAVRALGTGRLERFIEDYFPHIWADQKQAEEWAATFTKQRSWQGPKSFLKKRHIEYIVDGLEAGLKLKHPNPVDAVLDHLHQVYKYVACHRWLQEGRRQGYVRAFSVESMPSPPNGWEKLDPRVGTIFGPNKVRLEEIVDEKLWDAAEKIIADLGAVHERKPGIGDTAGAADPDTGFILTRFASPMGTLWHEIGHLLDSRFGLWKEVAGRDETVKAELTALADERFGVHEVSKSYRAYAHRRDEMIANLIDAFVTSREHFRKVAPTAFSRLEAFLGKHAETKPVLDLQPSLTRKNLQNEQPLGGLLVKGYWAAPKPVARIINRHLSPGLGHKASYRGVRWAFNLVNQAQLGLSGFHWMFTNMDAMISRGALGFYELAQGFGLDGLKNVVLGLSPTTPFQNVYRGHQIMKAALGDGTAAIPEVEWVVRAGGRFKQESIYHTDAHKALARGLRQKDVLAVVGNLLPAFFEITSKPLMEWWVPRQKLGVFALLAKFEVDRLGENADPVAVRHALARAWDSVDNRMGQLVYDNLFWNRTAKDVLMLAVRSLGWNIGDLRELGGGLYDLATLGARVRGAGRGEGGGGGRGPGEPGEGAPVPVDLRDPVLTHRMAYGMYLAFGIGVIGATIGYLTGHRPKELRDYYFPKTGAKNLDGTDERLSLPSYVKDVVAYKEHPLTTVGHKLHPALWEAYYLGRNADFFNRQIHDPNDAFFRQRLDDAQYVAKVMLPFSLRELAQEPRNPGTKVPRLAPMLGVTRAPSYVTGTPLTEAMKEFFSSRVTQGTKSHEVADRLDYLGRADDRLRHAKSPEERKAILDEIRAQERAGSLKPTDTAKAIRAGSQSPLEASFARPMPIEKALEFWDLASDDEKALIRPELLRKGFGRVGSDGHWHPAEWTKGRSSDEIRALMARLRAVRNKKAEESSR